MRLTEEERRELMSLLEDYLSHEKVREMANYIQHGRITTYEHCLDVAETSFFLERRLHLDLDEQALVVGAMLHDFYLYDWHIDEKWHRRHATQHAVFACHNAEKYFDIDEKTKAVIRCHMWPVTLFHMPPGREAWLVSLVDKYCSARETLFCRGWGKKE